jgi:leucyl aminopeptidase
MQSHVCYTSDSEHAIQLVMVAACDEVLVEHQSAVYMQQFKAKLGDWAAVGDTDGQVKTVYVGLGDEGDDTDAIARVVCVLPAGAYVSKTMLSSRALVMWSLAQYRFDTYKKAEVVPRILCLDEQIKPHVLAETSAVFLARDLINMPANHMGPKALAKAVEDVARLHGATYEVCVGDALLDENYPAIHAVGRAAEEAPRLASLTWGNPEHPRIALVGKGVCFDSGGLDLKPADGMRWMKKDMGGAANAIALAHWIMALKLPVYLELWIPAVENAVGPLAYRPGDVLTMRNGLTVEVDNTDAEGRLVLGDALQRACESKPELVIDLATLTGAARVAVGTEITAMFSNRDALAERVVACSADMNDPVWRMPLYQGYNRMLDSNIADVCNSGGGGYAGAITAALFLERFVAPDTAWVHCDLMGLNLNSRPGKPAGGEAMSIQALAAYLIERFG